MASTLSNMIPINSIASNFNLFDTVSGTHLSLEDLKGEKATVIFFICNHCPFVIHINKALVSIANDYKLKGISFIAISSNDVKNYPQDSPELMKVKAQEEGYPFPYLYDETQEVAKAFDAACTPDCYIYNDELKLIYRGQLDDSRPGNGVEVTGEDFRNALDCVLNKTENKRIQKPSMGCGIKWKS